MKRIIMGNAADPEDEVVTAVIETLTAGQAVVMPTETQYSLSVRADDEKVLEKIRLIKKRDEKRKPALFVKDMNMAEEFCVMGDMARRLVERFLPGPMTLVLPGRPDQKTVAAEFRSDLGFGIRISSSPLIKKVMQKAPFAVTATSANISGQTVPETLDAIEKLLGSEVQLYVDGGPCRTITPSTVVFVGEEIKILRHGLIAEAEIRRFLDEEKVDG